MKTNQIYVQILEKISHGIWTSGQQLPTERAFSKQYGVSRPTISRILNRLRDSGHIERKVGAGSFVAQAVRPSQPLQRNGKSIGLFVPGLGKGEIFEPICTHIAELSTLHDVTLIWGSLPVDHQNEDRQLVLAAERLIAQGVNGVFFQPFERERGAANKNRRISELFTRADTKVVLLDSDFLDFPERSPHDLVGIDNVAAGYQICKHFVMQGARRIDFLWPRYTAGTSTQRLIGYREALYRANITPNSTWEHEGDADDQDFIANLIEEGATNIICVNDETAFQAMRSLDALGISVPEDVRIAGFDDVKYAHLLRVPLTTMRQPCRELAEIALQTMINRIDQPQLPPSTISLRAELCVRRSSFLSDHAKDMPGMPLHSQEIEPA